MPTTTGISFNGVDNGLKSPIWTIGQTTSDTKKFTFSGWFETPTSSDQACFEAINNNSATVIVGMTGAAGYLGIFSARTPFVAVVTDQGNFYYAEKGINSYSYATKYYFMVVYDSTQATAANRVKIWFGPYNGAVSLQSFNDLGGGSTPALNDTYLHGYDASAEDYLGSNSGSFFKGNLADVFWLDGVTLADPSSLVSNYSTAAKPTTYSGSYGTTGYHLDFSNAGALGTDSSGNANNFTVNGLPTQLTGYFTYTANETADLAATEAADTAAFSTTVSRTATLAATEAQDTAALVVTVGNVELASLEATEAADVAALSVTVSRTLTLDATEAPDTASFALTTQPVTQPIITGGGRWREHRPNYRIHPEYDDTPKQRRAKPAPVETGVVLVRDPIPELRLGPVTPALNMAAEFQRLQHEAEQAAFARLERLKAIAKADDDWLLNVA